MDLSPIAEMLAGAPIVSANHSANHEDAVSAIVRKLERNVFEELGKNDEVARFVLRSEWFLVLTGWEPDPTS